MSLLLALGYFAASLTAPGCDARSVGVAELRPDPEFIHEVPTPNFGDYPNGIRSVDVAMDSTGGSHVLWHARTGYPAARSELWIQSARGGSHDWSEPIPIDTLNGEAALIFASGRHLHVVDGFRLNYYLGTVAGNSWEFQRSLRPSANSRCIGFDTVTNGDTLVLAVLAYNKPTPDRGSQSSSKEANGSRTLTVTLELPSSTVRRVDIERFDGSTDGSPGSDPGPRIVRWRGQLHLFCGIEFFQETEASGRSSRTFRPLGRIIHYVSGDNGHSWQRMQDLPLGKTPAKDGEPTWLPLFAPDISAASTDHALHVIYTAGSVLIFSSPDATIWDKHEIPGAAPEEKSYPQSRMSVSKTAFEKQVLLAWTDIRSTDRGDPNELYGYLIGGVPSDLHADAFMLNPADASVSSIRPVALQDRFRCFWVRTNPKTHAVEGLYYTDVVPN